MSNIGVGFFSFVVYRLSPLTHERAEGDDGQESLDENPEAVRQGAVVASVRVGFVDVTHVAHLRLSGNEQPSLEQQRAAGTVRVHG